MALDEVDFSLNNSSLAFWDAVTNWPFHLQSDMMIVNRSFTFLTAFTLSNPWSCGTMRLPVVRDDK